MDLELGADSSSFFCALSQFVFIEHLLCIPYLGRHCRHTVGKTDISLSSLWAGGGHSKHTQVTRKLISDRPEGTAFQTEGTASAKALRQEHAC